MHKINVSDCGGPSSELLIGGMNPYCLLYSHKWNTENPPRTIYFCMCASQMKTQLNPNIVRPSKCFISKKNIDLKCGPAEITVANTPPGSGSVVGIATGYGFDGPGIEPRWGRDFPHLSRLVLEPAQPPVQWVSGLSSEVKSGGGVTLTPHPLLVSWSWKGRAIPLLPLRALRLVQSLSACTRVAFTFFNTLPSKILGLWYK
jgi:hypothetical protein